MEKLAIVRVVLLVVAIVLQCIDLAQTTTIARNPAQWYETNPLMGTHPSVARVRATMASATAVQTVCVLLPDLWIGLTVASVWTLIELRFVWNNHSLGIVPDWRF